MKWKLKSKGNDRCIVSDCGQYQISRFTCGGLDFYQVYHGSVQIGDAPDGNKARKVAMQHKTHNEQKSPAAAIGGEAW